MTKPKASAEAQPTPEYDFTRLAAITCMPLDGLQELFAEEGLLPAEAVKLPKRPALFVRLCMVRLLKSGVDPLLLPDAAAMLADLFKTPDPVRGEGWLLLFNGSRQIVNTRPYMIDAVMRAKAEAIVVLDIAEAWRATE